MNRESRPQGWASIQGSAGHLGDPSPLWILRAAELWRPYPLAGLPGTSVPGWLWTLTQNCPVEPRSQAGGLPEPRPGPKDRTGPAPGPSSRLGRGHVRTLALPSLALHPGAWASSPVSLLLKRQLSGETAQSGELSTFPPSTHHHPGGRGSGASSTQMLGDEAAGPRPHRGLAPQGHPRCQALGFHPLHHSVHKRPP